MNLLLVFLIMLIFLALGMRLYIGILLASLGYFLFLSDLPLLIAAQRIMGPAQSTSLLAIPMFILLGALMDRSGIAERLLQLANLMVGQLKGGLALANIVLSTLMGGLSASNLADAAMMARMVVPEMERQGYSRGFAAAVTAASSLVTPIIPPGIALIIYALLADVSVGAMFMAGILPGLMGAALLMIATYHVAVRRGYKPARTNRGSASEWLNVLGQSWPAVLLIVAIIGGIRFAIFTPTEAGGVAVILTLIIGLLFVRKMELRDIGPALLETVRSTASVMLVIMASAVLAWIFSIEQAGQIMAGSIGEYTESPVIFLLVVNIVLLILGMFLEGTALLIILVPLLRPTLIQLGIDPVHFGIVMIVNLSIGTLTPPLGTVMLMVTNLTNVSMGEFLRDSGALFLALFVTLALVTYVPFISLALVY